MRHLIILIATFILPLSIHAKNPKFFKKARMMQLTILAYDKEGNIQQGQGFFINEQHDVLLEYELLEKAVSAKAVDAAGQEYDLTRVKGVSSLYNIAKLTSTASYKQKKVVSMPILTEALSVGTEVFVMPICSTDKNAMCIADTISKIETFEEGHNYYTLSQDLDERLASAPVFTAKGELIGSVQLSSNKEKQHGYVLAATYSESLKIKGIDANKYEIRSLSMPKALPEDESQATTFLYLTNKQDTLSYRVCVEDFVAAFPESSTGYIQWAEMEATAGHYQAAEKAYAKGIAHCKEHLDEIHHSYAKLLYQSGLLNEPVSEGWTLDKALEETNAAYKLNPLPLYTALSGMILYGQQQYEEAYEQFMAMGKSNMRAANYFLYAAQCKEMLNVPVEEILALQDSALACYSKPYPIEASNCLYLHSKTLTRMKKYRDAVKDLNEYEHLLAGNVNENFYYEREQLEMQCRMYQQALNDIDRAVSLQPQEPLYRAEQASVNYRAGLLDEALAAAQEAIKLDDTFSDAYRILGICLNDKGKKQEAKQALQKAIELGDELAKGVLEKIN